MTDPFDWAGLWLKAWDYRPPFVPREEGDQRAAVYPRARIEAAFVPVAWYSNLRDKTRLQITRAEAAEAREAKLREALTRQADNMAFALNNVSIPEGWYDKFSRELAEDRTALSDLIAGDADLIDVPGTLGDSDGDDGA